MVWLAAFISVLIVSLISLIGVFFLALKPDKLHRIQLILVGLATGGLLGGAFFHLIPEAYHSFKDPIYASLYVLLGFLAFFALERFLHWQHDHTSGISDQKNHIKAFGPLNLFSDAFHNLLDGVLIGAAYVYSTDLGIATTLTVMMHELPQEIGDFGVLIHAGYTPRRALFFNFLSACTSFLGLLLVLLFNISSDKVSMVILPFAAGGFIYLAAADLIPELHTEKTIKNSIYQFIALLAGMGLLLAMLFITE